MYKSVIHGIAKKYGKEYTPAIMKKLLGTPTMVTCNIAVTEMKLPISPEKFYDTFKQEARLRQHEIGYLPGILQVLLIILKKKPLNKSFRA